MQLGKPPSTASQPLGHSTSVSQELPGSLPYLGGGLPRAYCPQVSGKTDRCVILYSPSDLQDDFISPCGACRQVMREVSSSFSLECKLDVPAFPRLCGGVEPGCGKTATFLFAWLADFEGRPSLRESLGVMLSFNKHPLSGCLLLVHR